MRERCMEDFRTMQLSHKGYDVLEFLGAGATSEVFCVRKRETGLCYACKISSQTEWLELEAELMRRIRHPLYPQWKEFWTGQGWAFLVMEYIEGKNLKEYLEGGGRLSLQKILRIMLELTEGIAYLQDLDSWVIYKDLKPANIMIGRKEEVRLLDLGAAGIKKGWRVGTPGYSAPELLSRKDAATCSSDVYSLGVLMYQMLMDEMPPAEHGNLKALYKIRIRRWDVPFGIKLILERCIRQEPKERIPDVRTLYFLLADYYEAGIPELIGLEIKALFQKKWNKRLFFEKNIYKNRF